MDSTSLVSIIVPVYNVDCYLEKCVSTLVVQTYGNIEILLVDDGSTDGSGTLCDRLAERDSRIKVLHKPNGGLSDARNCGLRQASGEWVSFVDSDDWVSPVFIEALLRAALDTGCEISAVPSGKHFKDGDACVLVDSLDLVAPAKPLPSPRGAFTERRRWAMTRSLSACTTRTSRACTASSAGWTGSQFLTAVTSTHTA